MHRKQPPEAGAGNPIGLVRRFALKHPVDAPKGNVTRSAQSFILSSSMSANVFNVDVGQAICQCLVVEKQKKF
jgi:hypothetical protein